jgi:dTDP-4-amino-4,6-dideoxygalactose transaminase
MEAIRTLINRGINGDLPPVGRPIVCRPLDNNSLPIFEGYDSIWVDSGTSALALALLKAKRLRPDILEPEVIIPGYCCPDLIAAAHFSQVKPIVVDTNIDDPSFNIEILKSVLSDRSLAIIAVNFLGVTENIDALIAIKKNYPQLLLIEDNAQWFPAKEECCLLAGDFVSFSFGRGKPVSLLGGGLLLAKEDIQSDVVAVDDVESSALISNTLLTLKYKIYNQLLSPHFYQLLSRNPFFSLGKTQYHPLDKIVGLDIYRRSLLTTNIATYESADRSIEKAYDELFTEKNHTNAFKALLTSRRKRLLRYPYLFSTVEQKNKVFPKLVEYGLGASEMYKTSLPQVSGVNQISVVGDLTNSADFAQRFITLPLHSRVSEKHVKLIKKIFTF